MQVKPEIERFAKIRVVGVGGAGGNVINSMIDSNQIRGVEFVAINTDAQDLSINKAIIKIPIGQELTQGLGAGSNPEIGKKAAEESLDLIKDNLEGANMVFITAGLGGGTGTGASPIIAKIAKESGALTIGVVTKPFNFEGIQRMRAADKGMAELKKEVDALITIPNQKLLEVADDDMSIIEAFRLSDSVLNQGVQGISDLIVMPGLINVDFADVKTIMKDAGTALMGIGIGTGENRAVSAAQAAISSPLLEQSIEEAKGILFNISGGPDLTMKEVDRAANIIRGIASEEANIIFGTSIDDELTGQIKITVIATGFDLPEEDDSVAGYVEKHYSHIQKKDTKEETVKTEQPLPSQDTQKEPSKNPTNVKLPVDMWKPEDAKDEDYKDNFDVPTFLRQK